MNLKIFTDGGARGNPGPAGIGVVILDEQNNKIEEFKKYIGIATNNVAEYEALVTALNLAVKYKPCSLKCYMDSELICKQMLGSYKVKNENMIKYFTDAQKLLNNFTKTEFFHIPREQNKDADKLVNSAINLAVADKTKTGN